MKTSAAENFVNQVINEVQVFASNQEIKEYLGDSTTNHRVATVRQTIRYLEQTTLNDLPTKLETVYNFLLKKGFFDKVRRRNNRTDAYDINEFFAVMDRYVNKDPALKGQVSKLLNSI